MNMNSAENETPPSAGLFEQVYTSYKTIRIQRLEEVYQESVRPLIDQMFESLEQRRLIWPIIDQWKATRLHQSSNYSILHPGMVESLNNLDAYYRGSFGSAGINRKGYECFAFIEDMRLITHILNLHKVPIEDMTEITPEKVDVWKKIIDNPTPEEITDTTQVNIVRESYYLENYDIQLRDFQKTHYALLSLLYPLTPTPGTAYRNVFDTVLFLNYHFDASSRYYAKLNTSSMPETKRSRKMKRHLIIEEHAATYFAVQEEISLRKPEKLNVFPPFNEFLDQMMAQMQSE
jgi:hypothetical protein